MIKIKEQVAKIRKIGNSLYIGVKKEIIEVMKLNKGDIIKYSIDEILLKNPSINKENGEVEKSNKSELSDYEEFREFMRQEEEKEEDEK